MSVKVVTSLGDFVIKLYQERCPLTCENFLKLCKIRYYNGCLFYSVQKNFTAETGDRTGTGTGGDSIYKFLKGDQARFFKDEIHPDLKHSKMGIVAMASGGDHLNASEFYVTLGEDLDYLDGQHTVFGEVTSGILTLERINVANVDHTWRPFMDIRIKHTVVLEDPFEDPHDLARLIPDVSLGGTPKEEVDVEVRSEACFIPIDEEFYMNKLKKVIPEMEAHSRYEVVLESLRQLSLQQLGDIPDAGIKPPENVLFVCELSPSTEEKDLILFFTTNGKVPSAELISDSKTGQSLGCAFIVFEGEKECIKAMVQTDNLQYDQTTRIRVSFSERLWKFWNQFGRKGSKHEKEQEHI